jgi:hypothetical protein
MNFDIRKSSKSYINADEHFIVVRDDVLYLRIVGKEFHYNVLTATASEDSGNIVVFNDQAYLIEIALRVAEYYDAQPLLKTDHLQRPYVDFGRCDFLSDGHRAAEKLFEFLDQRQQPLE